jgi:hypothetical protein
MVSSTIEPISGSERKAFLDRIDVAERHLDRVARQLELAAIELAVGDCQNALGLAVERILRIDDLRPASVPAARSASFTAASIASEPEEPRKTMSRSPGEQARQVVRERPPGTAT